MEISNVKNSDKIDYTTKTGNITENPKASNNGSIIKTNVNNEDVNINSNPAKNLTQKVNEVIGVTYLNSSVIEENGIKYLVIARNENDKYDPAKRAESSLGVLKTKLGIPDNIISKYNDSKESTNRPRWSDGATIEPGHSIKIPLDTIGTKKGVRAFLNSNLYENLRNLAKEV